MNVPAVAANGAAAVADPANLYRSTERNVVPFEFRLLSDSVGDERWTRAGALGQAGQGAAGSMGGPRDRADMGGKERAGWDAMASGAVDAARLEGTQAGEREGRRAARAEMEAEFNATAVQQREQVRITLQQFRAARERYFADVEPEVVKLALAIAARVLHREAHIDPLLLSGVVRVALEKMADRSGVVLRVRTADVAAWEMVFQAAQPSERPQVAGDEELERGECVLDTKMGTVELGVKVQLEEIEKGFFDLLNHRPTE